MVQNRWLYVVAYVVLWSGQALLIKQSVQKSPNDSDHAQAEYPYEILSMIMLSEVFKLVIALSVYFFTDHEWDGAKPSKLEALMANFGEGTSLIIPALIYAAYNGLSFISLKLLEPGTIRVLINLRVIFSGLLLHFLFQQRLVLKQWIALLLLFSACAVEQSGSFHMDCGVMALLIVLAQGFCSSLGGIYFQWLLQRNYSLGIWVKNIYLYSWSICIYFFAICAFRPDLLSPAYFLHNIDFKAVKIIIIAGLGGIFTALLLRHLNVIVKEYANFAEMIVVAIAQNKLFGTPLRPTLFLAICLVTCSLILYRSIASTDPKKKTSEISHLKKGLDYVPISIK